MDAQQRFARILQLFYLCMDHEPLYTCLRALCEKLSANPPVRGSQALAAVLHNMAFTPRTLKQLSRVVIYRALRHKPGLLVSKIGLPPVLRDYVLSFEPWFLSVLCFIIIDYCLSGIVHFHFNKGFYDTFTYLHLLTNILNRRDFHSSVDKPLNLPF